jgi:hypothetical protein
MFHMLIQSSDFLNNFLTPCSFNSGSLELLSDVYCLLVYLLMFSVLVIYLNVALCLYTFLLILILICMILF